MEKIFLYFSGFDLVSCWLEPMLTYFKKSDLMSIFLYFCRLKKTKYFVQLRQSK